MILQKNHMLKKFSSMYVHKFIKNYFDLHHIMWDPKTNPPFILNLNNAMKNSPKRALSKINDTFWNHMAFEKKWFHHTLNTRAQKSCSKEVQARSQVKSVFTILLVCMYITQKNIFTVTISQQSRFIITRVEKGKLKRNPPRSYIMDYTRAHNNTKQHPMKTHPPF